MTVSLKSVKKLDENSSSCKDPGKEEKAVEMEKSVGSSNIKLYLVVASCFLANLTMGQVLGFSAVLLPQLANERDLPKADASLIASLSNVGQLVATISASFLASFLGRKWTIVIMCSVTTVGFFVAAFSGGATSLLVLARVLQGAAIVCSVVQMYISEVSPLHLRGFLGALGTVGISGGVTLVYCLGAAMHWTHAAIACAHCPLVCMAAMAAFCPESPAWLYSRGRGAEAESSLRWLRGQHCDLREELKTLSEQNSLYEIRRKTSWKELFVELQRPEILRACLLLAVLMTLMMANGATVIVFYAVDIVQGLNVVGNSYLPAILVSVVRLIGSIVGMVLLKRLWGKKSLLTVTSVLMSLAVALLGLQLYYKEQLAALSGDSVWLGSVTPIALLVVYMLAFGIGPATVPWTLQGELVPTKVAPLVSGISVVTAISTLYCLTQSYPFMEAALGLAGTFWVYAVVCLAMAMVSAMFLPETNGRAPKEVLAHFVASQKELSDLA